ncbi:hypothetical protein QN224_33205 [Sinorhizobium sp. 8-89]|uniref:hypothetical protein n=1 Tax=Sinorhizobium sp. 7-81 TaxID=3049087 RepID=UPI0024C21A87|nr:hypothetical protein [Sinorhizobium sp. 7-81]MDK1390138.1 hypothetical protein [Sinorhizobium sp. 7-81]
MKASDYLKRSGLYRKLLYCPYREFARVYAAKMSSEGLGRRCTWRSLSLSRDLMDWNVGNGIDPKDFSEVHVDRFLVTVSNIGAPIRATDRCCDACFLRYGKRA